MSYLVYLTVCTVELVYNGHFQARDFQFYIIQLAVIETSMQRMVRSNLTFVKSNLCNYYCIKSLHEPHYSLLLHYLSVQKEQGELVVDAVDID